MRDLKIQNNKSIYNLVITHYILIRNITFNNCFVIEIAYIS